MHFEHKFSMANCKNGSIILKKQIETKNRFCQQKAWFKVFQLQKLEHKFDNAISEQHVCDKPWGIPDQTQSIKWTT